MESVNDIFFLCKFTLSSNEISKSKCKSENAGAMIGPGLLPPDGPERGNLPCWKRGMEEVWYPKKQQVEYP